MSRKVHFFIFDLISALLLIGLLTGMVYLVGKSYEAEAASWERTERQVVEWVPSWAE